MARDWTLEGRIRTGKMTLILPNGGTLTLSGRTEGPEGTMVLRRWRAIRRIVASGGVGFGEAYVDGDWESPDLPAVIETAARNLPAKPRTYGSFSPWRLTDRVGHALRPNTRSGSAKNIAAHYDLGNEFYAEWLDPSMTYSAAVFSGGANDLESAQAEKYRRLLNLIDAQPGESILEIGCGWGGFAIQAARERDVKVTALTISRAQYNEARKRVSQAGLSERVDIQLRDYRDISEKYDHAVSIEMIEAVGERYWPEYFRRVADSLKTGGRFALQTIVIENERFDAYRRGADFIQKHIFPGGSLPCPDTLRTRGTDAGLKMRSEDSYGLDYAETLARWRRRFDSATDRVNEMGFDDRFRRCWMFYLAYCEGGFRAGNIDALQVAYSRD